MWGYVSTTVCGASEIGVYNQEELRVRSTQVMAVIHPLILFVTFSTRAIFLLSL